MLQALLPYLILIGLAPILSRGLDFIGVASVRKWIALGAFTINLVLDLILIPTIGLLGAAIGTNVAILTFVGGHYILIARRLPLDERRLARALSRAVLAALLGGLLCALMLSLPGPPVVLLAIGALVGIVTSVAALVILGELSMDELRIPHRLRRRRRDSATRDPGVGPGRSRGNWRLKVVSPNVLLPAGAVLIALIVGGALGRSPLLTVGGLVALGLIVLLLSDITIGVVAFVLIQPLALVVGGGESLISKGAGVILVVTWLVSLRYPSARKNYLSFVANNPVLTGAIAAFMVWCLASILWTLNVSSTIDAIQRYALGFLLLAIVFTATRDRRAAILVAGAFSISAMASTLIGLATGNSPEGRLAGTFEDPNEFAAFCVPALLIAAALAATALTPLRRLAFGVGALVCGLGIVLSGSRGGIVAIAAALVMWIIFGGRWRLKVIVASVLVGVVVVGYINVAASPATRTRLETLTQSEELSTNGGTGRTDIWQVGLRAYHDHPIVGSGAGTFTEATPRYLARPGLVRRGDFFTDTPKVAHNMYLHVLVEIGVVGLALFGLILVACLAAAWRAARLFKRAGDLKMELLSRTLLAGTAGILVADFFISGQYQRVLWILLGLCVALLGIARGAVPQPPRPMPSNRPVVILPPERDRVAVGADR